jgi:lysozyme family protein
MSANFEQAIPVVMAHEGTDANPWVDDPADPGGETIWGWSMLTIRKLGLRPRDLGLNLDEFVPGCLKAVTKETCEELYRRHFWLHFAYGRILGQKPATKIFDAAVNMGDHRAHQLAQAAAGLGVNQQDGVLGMISIGSINLMDPQDFVNSYAVQLAAFYRSIAVGPKAKFLSNWLKRAAWGSTLQPAQ